MADDNIQGQPKDMFDKTDSGRTNTPPPPKPPLSPEEQIKQKPLDKLSDTPPTPPLVTEPPPQKLEDVLEEADKEIDKEIKKEMPDEPSSETSQDSQGKTGDIFTPSSEEPAIEHPAVPSSPISSSASSAPKPKKSSLKKIIILVLILIVIVGGGAFAYYYYNNIYLSVETPETTEPPKDDVKLTDNGDETGPPPVDEGPSPDEIIIDTSGWSSYKHDNIGIEFKYPSEYEIIKDDLQIDPADTESNLIIESTSQDIRLVIWAHPDGLTAFSAVSQPSENNPFKAGTQYILKREGVGLKIDRISYQNLSSVVGTEPNVIVAYTLESVGSSRFVFLYINNDGENIEEVFKAILSSVTLKVDTDKDGLFDDQEALYGTDINNPDTDGDGYTDGEEVKNGYNPLGEGMLGSEE